MDVTKAPPLDANATQAGSTPPPRQGAASPAFAPPAPLQDRIDIQPLDVAAALQILIAEVRTELQLPVDALQPQSPTQAAMMIIHAVLAAVPDGDGAPPGGAPPGGVPQSWIAAATRVDAAVQTALDRAVQTVAAWRDVPHAAVDAARETRALVATQLSDEPQSPLWSRPEWLSLAPRIQRYWRRRRFARRGLIDPDSLPPGDAGGDRTDPPGFERQDS